MSSRKPTTRQPNGQPPKQPALVPSDPSGFKHMFDPWKLTKPNVAIVGFTGHRTMAFELDDTWEVWGINELHRHHPVNLFHRWFEIHDIKDFHPQDGKPGDLAHLQELAKLPIPVYMHEHFQDIPASLPFPKREIEEGLPRGGYQTNSISWEVALALLWMEKMPGPHKIGIYGVDMANDSEYQSQRPCLEYWMGVAEGRGIEVIVPQTSDLCKAWGQYGFGSGDDQYLKMKERLAWLHNEDNTRLQMLRQLEAENKSKREDLLAQRNQLIGAINDTNYYLRSFGVQASNPGLPTPDRTADPRTGIAAAPVMPPQGPALVTEGVVAGGPPELPTEPHGLPAEVLDRIAKDVAPGAGAAEAVGAGDEGD